MNTGGQVRERLLENTEWAWESVAQQKLGLFSGPWQPETAPLSAGDLRDWDAHAEDVALISALHAHHQWTLALLEFWEAFKHEIGVPDCSMLQCLLSFKAAGWWVCLRANSHQNHS